MIDVVDVADVEGGEGPRALRRRLREGLLAAAAVALLASSGGGCATQVSRGGEGTGNPGLDNAPMSTGLDKRDIDYLVDQNLGALFESSFWRREVVGQRGEPLLVTIYPIRNDTSEHLNDEMNTLLSSIETALVDSGEVGVVSRERQDEMMREVGLQQSSEIDPYSAAQVGRQLGARYYFTGKLGAVDERLDKARRLQYSLFIQVIDVETSLIKFQHDAARSKAIER
ncbi:MAG: penicillin-binding protein activator LpoB [Deltaproteobacteria bacterium]|nr:penicillin-binding protein activator LpoB [Deltaproteobacteria bacterium]